MSELRQDPISGDWVIIAPGRASRPKMLDAVKPPRVPTPLGTCPFEDPEHSGNENILAAWPNRKHWRVLLLPNKYPIVAHHELIITRDHNKNFADLPIADAVEVFTMIKRCYHAAMEDGSSQYVVPFFNWGAAAGASIWHPHYQALPIPVVPAHTATSLENAKKYFAKHKRCLRCDIISRERKAGVRVIDENTGALALAPYASKMPFEMAIMPKRHLPYFREASPALLRDVASMLQSVMKRLRKNANDPDLNFFIHDAPLGEKKYPHHHWHIEILPRVTIPAGFEFSTGMYVNLVTPEDAAKILRGGK